MKSLLVILFITLSAISDAAEPLWMRYPSISPDGSLIAFSYQGDLFVVDSKGGTARQLTSNSAHDFQPIWSPDGNQIAFSSDRYGNFDVYVISKDGGSPKRITYHSASDFPYEFTNDGKYVIYKSSRLGDPKSAQFPSRSLHQLYKVGIDGGREQRYSSVAAEDVQFSEDGKLMLFHNKKGYEDPWRKHHTSSVTRDIVLYNIESKKYTMITSQTCEDRNPIWGDGINELYFLSEKSGSFNIWKGELKNPYGEQLTNYDKNPVRFLSRSNNGMLCYGYDGEIYTFSNGVSQKVSIQIKKDNVNNESVIKTVTSAGQFDVSPNNKEVAFIYRGEVFVTSIEYSTTKRITNTPEQERSVSFSPDGEKLIFAGERNESWNIYEVSHDRENEKYFYNATLIKEEELVSNGEETFLPKYSPDGKEVAFLENRTTLRVINLESKKIRTVLPGDFNYSYSDGDQYYSWAPDSKWFLVQFFEFERWSSDVGLVNASGKEKPINLTQSGYGNGSPKFAMDGEMVYYSTAKYGYRSHGSWGSEQDVEAIFLTESAYQKFKLNKEDYALWKEEEKDNNKNDKEEKDEKDNTDEEKKDKTVPLKIEVNGLMDRRVKLTIHSSHLADFLVTNEGDKMYYMTRFEDKYNIWTTNFKEHETKMLGKVNSSESALVFDKEEANIFFNSSGKIMKLDLKTGKPKPVPFNSEMNLNSSAEREYMFNHAWRQVREKFYVEDLHGVDWNMYKKEYAKFLPYINNGYDFAEMLSELLGEINASHTGARYRPRNPNGDQTASLGCYYDESYSGKGVKIYEVLEKGPLDTKSNKILAGVIIEKMDGIEITENMNFYKLLNRKKGNKMLLSLYNPTTKERWEEIVKPISSAAGLAYDRFVRICEEKVDELSDGRLGYVHIQGMNSSSFRVLFDKALGKYHKKEALIVDTRFNGGGWLHDDLATFLSGKMYMSFEPRGQKNMGGEPIWKWQKPSCVLMSEGNYSDAHLFPFTYKALGIGKLIGMPVPGTGTAVWWERMLDGTVFGIPQVGMRAVEEGYLVENHDLEPDIIVNNDYEQFTNGTDQQLRAAVDELLKNK